MTLDELLKAEKKASRAEKPKRSAAAKGAPAKAEPQDPERKKQNKEAQAKYRKNNPEKVRSHEKNRTRYKTQKRIVGVDGEGQDIFLCKRCKAHVASVGGTCTNGGEHVRTLGCRKCGELDPHLKGGGSVLSGGTGGVAPDSGGGEEASPRSRKKAAPDRRVPAGVCARGGEHELRVVADGHIYTYLAAVDEYGRLVSEAWNENGLTHDECADMLLKIPRNTLKFGFMFSYDVTKIIEDLPSEVSYYLLRPAAREGATCAAKHCKEELPRGATECHACEGTKIRKTTRPIDYNGRSYDFFHGSLTVEAIVDERARSTKVWDCFRFFGVAFVEALRSWSSCKAKGCDDGKGSPGLADGFRVGTETKFRCRVCGLISPWDEGPVATAEDIERIDAMKRKRGAFDVEDPENVKRYCRSECRLLARMMRRLVDAHERAGIPLKRYDGAGSTASALLRVHEVAEYKGPKHKELDPELRYAIECAFFGGRFEDSVVGLVKRPVHGYDISSAYPYAETHLPCLQCGFWSFDKRMTLSKMRQIVKRGGLVLGRFHVRHVPDKERREIAWCPLPFRSDKGSISYGTNFSGWSWAPELISALEGWPDLVELGSSNGDEEKVSRGMGHAWVYETRCDHQPFAFIPNVYRQRNEWGKDGAGIVLKLGMNASYGKTAQSLGDNPPFQSWIWAGMTTATTRGQLNNAIASAKDRWNVLAVATDGIFALEELPLKAPPRETGTSDMKKPLGGWEYKGVPEGVFIAKPGLYYSLEQKFVRARGVGRREVKELHALLEQGFADWDRRDPKYAIEIKSRRFYGAKHSIYGRSACLPCERSWPGVPEQLCPDCGRLGTKFETQMIQTEGGRNAYGTWDERSVRIAFDPYPKREREGVSRRGPFAYLCVRDLGGAESAAYDVGGATTTPEGQAARRAKDFDLEQPDWPG